MKDFFNQEHRVTGLIHYYMQSTETTEANDEISSIPKRYQALSARATYSYKDAYLIEGNVGYTGSEKPLNRANNSVCSLQ